MKKSLTWIILGVVVVAALVYIVIRNRDNSATNQMVDSNQTENTMEQGEVESSSIPASLKELMARSSSTRCEFSSSEDNNNSSGVVYAANGKARVDFSSTVDSKTTNGHMIMDSEMAYTWIDGEAKGFKVSVESMESTKSEQTTEKQFDPEKKLDYHCDDNWSVDTSVFVIPGDIEFMDIKAMMPSIDSNTQGSITPSNPNQSAQCAACDQVPEANRTQCRTALGCN